MPPKKVTTKTVPNSSGEDSTQVLRRSKRLLNSESKPMPPKKTTAKSPTKTSGEESTQPSVRSKRLVKTEVKKMTPKKKTTKSSPKTSGEDSIQELTRSKRSNKSQSKQISPKKTSTKSPLKSSGEESAQPLVRSKRLKKSEAKETPQKKAITKSSPEKSGEGSTQASTRSKRLKKSEPKQVSPKKPTTKSSPKKSAEESTQPLVRSKRLAKSEVKQMTPKKKTTKSSPENSGEESTQTLTRSERLKKTKPEQMPPKKATKKSSSEVSGEESTQAPVRSKRLKKSKEMPPEVSASDQTKSSAEGLDESQNEVILKEEKPELVQENEVKLDENENKLNENELKSNENNKELDESQTEVTSEEMESELVPESKRKLEETDIEFIEDLDECHVPKKVKKARFEVPIIPQIGGNVYTFGEEIAGELGPRETNINGVKVKRNEPSIIKNIEEKVVQVVCGALHTICLTIDGNVLTFGCNDDSALGRQTTGVESNLDESNESFDDSDELLAKTPERVVGLPKIVKVSAGDMHSVALSVDGTVYIWGNFKDDSKKLGLTPDSLQKVDSEGKNMNDFSETNVPKLVDSLGSTKIVDIASGCHHILLLTENGEVLSFGEGSKGQLGRIPKEKLQSVNSERQLFLTPQKVEFDDSTVVISKIWSAHWSSFAQSTNGDIYGWGLNNFHQLGFKTEHPIDLLSLDPNESQQSLKIIAELRPTKSPQMPSNIKMIANGQHHMLALDTSGQVYSCGSCTYGKLGLGDSVSTDDQSLDSPRPISKDAFNGESVTHIACGEFCSLAVIENGRLYGWGQGSKQIGTEFSEDLNVPTLVKGLITDNTNFLSVSSGAQHSGVVGINMTLNGN